MQLPSFPPIGPITIPLTIIIILSALTSKLIRNLKFSQPHRVFLVFLYQMDTSNEFLRRYFPFSINLVFYAITSLTMAKIKNIYEQNVIVFFILHVHIKFQENRVEDTDLPIVPLIPYPNWRLYPKMKKAVIQKGNY